MEYTFKHINCYDSCSFGHCEDCTDEIIAPFIVQDKDLKEIEQHYVQEDLNNKIDMPTPEELEKELANPDLPF